MKKSMSKIAVLGATGQVGRDILQMLAAMHIPLDGVVALATSQSAGNIVGYGEEDEIKIQDAAKFDYTDADMVISAVPADVALKLLPGISKQGVKVIDCSPAFRMNPDTLLTVAGVNDELVPDSRTNIVALPDAMVSMLVQALKPLHDMAHIKRVVVSTYQSANQMGRAAMDELFNQTRSVYVNDPIVKESFPKQIAFNAIPQAGNFREDGQTDAEFTLVSETKKILDTKIKCAATCVWVPSFLGTALSVTAECDKEVDLAALRAELRMNDNIAVVDHRNEEGYVTPAESAGEDSLYISRIRDDISVENGVSLWVVADTIRVGVALNAVRTALTWLAEGSQKIRTVTVH